MRKRLTVEERLRVIAEARTFSTRSGDDVLRRALDLYSGRQVVGGDLRKMVATLESGLRAIMPEVVIFRAPKSVSTTPRQVGLLACQPRVIDAGGRFIVSAESHGVVLTTSKVSVVSGFLPGWTGPHLFERVHERLARDFSITAVLLSLSRLWPTLLLMRARQRLAQRGSPLHAIVTPFEGGLLFASIEKVSGMPPTGMVVTEVDTSGARQRILRDWYADQGSRVWVGTKTFVGSEQLSLRQQELRDRLEAFATEYDDVIADADWRWRIGLGQADESVELIGLAFRLSVCPLSRREDAYDVLEAIVSSDLWMKEVAKSVANQSRNGGSKRRMARQRAA